MDMGLGISSLRPVAAARIGYQAPTTTAWDVTYEFKGVERHVQLSAPPGPTIAVNGYGQPRG
jgi:hypothetical protein